MAMAAGKFAGKPPKMTDKAFKPPAEAAMAMTGNERPVGEAGMISRATWIVFFWRRLGLDFVFIIILRMSHQRRVRHHTFQSVGTN
jgi:hypothetical protein